MASYILTREAAFAKAREYASKGSPQAVLRNGGIYDEIHTDIFPESLMQWLFEADEFWIVRTDGSITGPHTSALVWIRSKVPILGFERW
ncbi:MAG: hypothetical protein AAB443_02645 [Patescibacteria group bacterium]